MLMDYRIKRVGQSDELEHALFGFGKKKSSSSSGSGSGQQGAKKGSTWSNHLYIARQKAGDGWRYFYSQAELQAAKAKGAAKQAAKNVGDTARKGLATVKRAGSKAADIASGKYARELDERRGKAAQTAFLAGLHGETKRLNATGEYGSYETSKKSMSKYNGLRNEVESLERQHDSEIKKYKSGDTSSINKLEKIEADIDSAKKRVSTAKSQAEKDFIKAQQDKYDISRYEYAGKQAEKERDRLDEERKGIAYKISDFAGKAKKFVDSGKSAISKFLSDESAMAKEAWNGSAAKKAIDKGKNAIDKLGKVLYKYDISRYEYAGKQAEKERDRLDEERKGIAYKISDFAGKAKKFVDSGKSAISKFLSDESAMAKEAWNGSVAKKAIDKGKNAIDKLGKVLSGAKGVNTNKAPQKENNNTNKETVITENIIPENIIYEDRIEDPQHLKSSKKSEGNEAPLPKNTRQYNGTSKKAEGDETRATKDMYKNSSDEYIEALYFNSRKNDGSGVNKYLENEYNYRKAAQEANYLGRLTDSLSDDAEAALKKYGKNSDTYKRAYEKMEEAFDQLHEAELELARYEKNR